MNGLILCLVVVATAGSQSPPAPDTAAPTGTTIAIPDTPRADAWIAEDKLQHFAMSFAATAFAYGGARTVLDPDAALIVAGSTALLAGIGKEIHDARSGRWFSLKDLAWDVAGVALGLTLANHTR
jgi:uncharacterized protein YfiM (DUF2279 family)